LLGAERDTEYIDIGDLMEIERQAAPAAADIEHALSRLEQQLGGDMPLLVSLCLLQAITSNSTPKASMCRPVRSMSPPKIPRASSVSISSRTARTHLDPADRFFPSPGDGFHDPLAHARRRYRNLGSLDIVFGEIDR
jgi:hypothetical protein